MNLQGRAICGFGAWVMRYAALLWAASPSTWAHNVDQRMNWMAFDQVTLDMIEARAETNSLPLIRSGDILGIVIKASPEPSGATTGAGGYLTFYPPEGVQVTGASYVVRDADGGFTDVPIKGQAIMAIGDGSVGGEATSELVGLTLGPNAVGQTELSVAASGTHRGTLAGLYGDTGIFYSVDPATAWRSWDGGEMNNNRGETVMPLNRWDAHQLRAFGRKGEDRDGPPPILDPDGRGSTPWGLGSPVAGPQSGYAWQFDGDFWDASGQSAADLRASITLGPWQRIRYAGSQIAFDHPGLKSSDIGYAGVVTDLGAAVSSVAPLPPTVDWTDGTSPKAVRWSVGMLQAGQNEYVRVWTKVLANPGQAGSPFDVNGCFEAHAEVSGGDAGGEQGGKDHPWRYYDPTYASMNPGSVLTVAGNQEVVKNGGTFQYDIEYLNASTVTMTNVVITSELPDEVRFNTSVPTRDSGPNPLQWNVGTLAPGEKFTARIFVKAESDGVAVVNEVGASNDQGCPATASEVTWFGENPILVANSSVVPEDASPGDVVQYTLRVDNQGAGPSGDELVIQEYLPEYFEFVSLDSVSVNQSNGLSKTTVDASDPRNPVFTIDRAIKEEHFLELVMSVSISKATPRGTYHHAYTLSHFEPVLEKDVTVASGPQAPVTIGGSSIGDTVFRDWDGDGVQDAEDEGIPGVTLQLDTGATATTDGLGQYLFNTLLPGTYTVTVTDTANVLLGYEVTTAGRLEQTVTVGLTEEQFAVDFGFQPGGPGILGGRVYEDLDNDGELDAGTETGLAGVRMNLYEDSDQDGVVDPEDYLLGSVDTGGDGSYQFSDLALGLDYLIDVDENDADLVSAFSPNAYLLTSADPVEIRALSGTLTQNHFGFFELAPATVGGSVFLDQNSSDAFDSGDSPVANIPINLYRDANGNGVGEPGEWMADTRTDAAGSFQFTGLGPDDYVVVLDDANAEVPGGFFVSASEFVTTVIPGDVVNDADFPYVRLISKQVDLASAEAGDRLNYTLTLNYDGSDLLTGLTVEDVVPAGTTLVSIGQGGGLGNVNSSAGVDGVDPGGVLSGGTIEAALLKDNWLDEDNDGDNHGDETELAISPTDGRAGRAILQFDLSGVPSAATVSAATLSLHQNSSERDAVAETLEVRALTERWVENGRRNASNWKDRLARASWSTEGGSVSGTVYATASAPVGDDQPAAWDLQSLVSDWVEGVLPNHGLLIKAAAENAAKDTEHYFSSREGSHPPTLSVTYQEIGPITRNSIEVSPDNVKEGESVTVTMTLESNESLSDVAPGSLSVTAADGVGLSLGDPVPASQDIAPGVPVTFTWTATASSPAAAGSLTVEGTASESGAGGYAFVAARSNSIYVSPLSATDEVVQWILGSHSFGTTTTDGEEVVGGGGGAAGESAGNPLLDPGTLEGEGNVGDVIYYQVTGTTNNQLWGTDVYTHDSDLSSAAVHAGLIVDGEIGVVKVTILAGQSQYTESNRNGVQSQSWGSWHTSFQVEAAGSALSSVVTLFPDKDTWIHEGEEGGNWGRDDELRVSPDDGKLNRALLQFDLSAIPAGVKIRSASLRLFQEKDGRDAEQETFEIRALTESWAEGDKNNRDGTSNWLERSDASDWSNVGGTYSNTVYATSPVAAGTNLAVSWDVVTLVQAWHDGSLANHGLLIKDDTETSGEDTEHRFSSSEGDTPPTLVVEYASPLGGTIRSNALSAAPTVRSHGDLVSVEMTLTAEALISGVTPEALSVTATNGATAVQLFGPTPSSADVSPGNDVVFSWTYIVFAGTEPGSVVFSGGALGDSGFTEYSDAFSNSVMVVPQLTFEVEVNDPLEVGAASNIATIYSGNAGGGLSSIPLTESNQVLTLFSAAIGDFVWIDLNADGVYQPSLGEVPLGGVEVCATNGVDTYCDTTDGDGFYQIVNLHSNGGNPWTVTLNQGSLPPGFLPTTSPVLERTLPTDTTIDNAPDFGVQPPPPSPASVEGRLWVDADGDGVADLNEIGIEGSVVDLYWDTNGNHQVDAADVLMTRLSSAADGTFVFEGLPAGDYLLRVDEDSALTTEFGVPTVIGAAMDLSVGSNPYAVALVAGQVDTGASFSYRWAGSIGNYVWYDFNGNGAAELSPPDGGGVADVALLLYYDSDGDGKKVVTDPVVGFALTDISGIYQFNHLPPGDYVVDVDESTVPTPPSSSNPGEFDRVVSTTGDNHAVSLLPKQTYDQADFGWIEAGWIGDTVFHDENANGVRDVGESGLPDVRVDVSGEDLLGNAINRITVTDGGGRYGVIVPAGNYIVSYDTEDPDIPANLVVATTPSSLSAVISSGLEFQNADFGRADGGGVTGKIYSDVDASGSLDPAEPGLAGITVSLLPSGGGSALEVTVTDAMGAYAFPAMPEGAYDVVVDESTVPTDYRQTGDPDEVGACVACDGLAAVTIFGAQTTANVDFGFQHAGSQVQIRGAVFEDVDGDGVRGDVATEGGLASVSVQLDCGIDGQFVVTTEADGSWEIFGVLTGSSCDLSVDEATLPTLGYEVTTASVITLNNIGANISDQLFGYQLQLGGVSGRIVEGDGDGQAEVGEAPISGISVEVTHEGADATFGTDDDIVVTTASDVNGAYAASGLPSGLVQIVQSDHPDYVFLADADGGRPDTITLTLGAGETRPNQDFENQVLPKAAISGVVFSDLSGEGSQEGGETGLENVTLALYLDANNNNAIDGGDTLVREETTDGSGAFQFAEQLPGDYIVTVTDANGVLTDHVSTSPDPHELALAGSDYVSAHFGYQPPLASIGDLVWNDADGDGTFDGGSESGLAQVTLDLYRDLNSDGSVDAGDSLVNGAITDASGAYDFTNLPAGDYLVVVTDINGVLQGLSASSGASPESVTLSHAEDQNNADFGFTPSVLTKTVDKTGALAGETLTYTLTPSLTSSTSLTDVLVSDAIPQGTSYVPGSATPTPTSEAGPITWNLGTSVAGTAGSSQVSVSSSGAAGSGTLLAFRGDDRKDFWEYDVDTDTWSSLADAPEKVKGGGALTTDGDDVVYALRGDRERDFWRYVRSTDTWSVLADAPDTVDKGGSLVYINGLIYALRGGGEQDFWRYDVTADVWIALASTSNPMDQGGSLEYDGNGFLYALRGADKKDFYRYEIATNTWIDLADTPSDVSEGAGLALVDNFLYALRGDNKDDFYRYDIAGNFWISLADTPAAVDKGGALVPFGDVLYAFEGNAKGFWRYDIASDTWTALANTPHDVKEGGAKATFGVPATTATVALEFSVPTLVVSGETLVVQLEITSPEDLEDVNFASPGVVATNGASAVLDDVDVKTVDLAAGVAQTVTWDFVATAGAEPATLVFVTGNVNGAVPGSPAISNSVIVTPPIRFQVQVADPLVTPLAVNVASIADTSGNLPSTASNSVSTALNTASIAGQVRYDVDGDGDPSDADVGIFSTTVELFTDLNGDQDPSGETRLASVVTDDEGDYQFGDLPRGRYVIVATDRAGTVSTYDTQGNLTDNWIAVTVVADSTGHDFLDTGFAKPDRWDNWTLEFAGDLGGENQPNDNPEGDIYDNLLEYALCLHPGSGLPGPGGFRIASVNEHIDLSFYRAAGGLTDVTYLVQGLPALPIAETEVWENLLEISGEGAPPAGVIITDLGNGIEQVTVKEVDLLSPLSQAEGFVRLEIQLDNGVVTATSYTRVHSWSEVTIEKGRFQTFSNSLLAEEELSGTVDSLSETHVLNVTTSLGDADLGALFDWGNASYYIEVVEGDFEGHRFDVSAAGVGYLMVAVDTDLYSGPPFNTLLTAVAAPALLEGDQFVLRQHQTLNSLFQPTAPFVAQATSLDANSPPDRVLFFDGGWQTYWLHDPGNGDPYFWDLEGNAAFIDAGSRVIAPHEGAFMSLNGKDITFLNIGIVRKNAFAVPLRQGHTFIGGGFPMDQGPAFRGMTADLFDGDPDPGLADSVFVWLGDQSASAAQNYLGVYLLENSGIDTPRWSFWDDSFFSARDFDTTVFPSNRSAFYWRVNAPMPDYVMPLPWCINLVGE